VELGVARVIEPSPPIKDIKFSKYEIPKGFSTNFFDLREAWNPQDVISDSLKTEHSAKVKGITYVNIRLRLSKEPLSFLPVGEVAYAPFEPYDGVAYALPTLHPDSISFTFYRIGQGAIGRSMREELDKYTCSGLQLKETFSLIESLGRIFIKKISMVGFR